MGLQNVLSVRVEKVLDEQGNELKAPLPYLGEPDDYGYAEALGGLSDSFRPDGAGRNNLSKQVPILLQAPKGVRKLREIHGHFAVEVLTPPQALITMEDILNAADKTVRGPDGGSLRVLEISRDDKGKVTLLVVLEKPPEPRKPFVCMPLIFVPAGGAPDERQPIDVNVVGKILSLVNEKGEALRLVVAEARASDGGKNGAVEYRLTFQPAGVREPAKLVYTGQRQTTIDVPFVLKDVPLQ
jgi:hypothetical protein